MFEGLKKTVQNFIRGKSLETLQGILPVNFGNYKTHYGKQDYLEAYEVSIYAHKCIEKRAEKVSEIEFQVLNGDDIIENHEVLKLLNNPNKAQTGSQFWGLSQKYLDIFGEVYIIADQEKTLRGNRVNTLQHLRPDCVKPKFNQFTGEIESIEYEKGDVKAEYDGDQVIYLYRPDPVNQLRGMSIMKAGIRAIQTGVQIDEYHSKVLKNGGRVEGVFSFKQENLTKEQLIQIKAAYQEQYAEAQKIGKPLFLGGDAKYERMGLNPSELAYLETKKVTLEDILMLTGVPKVILGSFDNIKYDNAEHAYRIFLRETIKPLLNQLATKLDIFLFPEDEITLSFVDPTPEDREEVRKDIESGSSNYYMTTNEKRIKSGLPILTEKEDADADKILRPMNLVSSDEEAPEPTSPVDEDDEKEDEEDKEKSIKGFVHPLSKESARRAYEKLVTKRMENNEKKFKSLLKEYFEDQKNRIVDSLSPENKHVFRKKDLISEIFLPNIEVRLAKEAFGPFMREVLREAGQNASTVLGSDFAFNMTSNAESWLNQKTDIFAQQINDTTFNDLKGQFSSSLGLEETRAELIERIENAYGDISTGRAGTIASTEVHGLMQFGTFEAYKQAGLPIKVWVSVGDGKVRSSHQTIDGEERPLLDPFSNGLQFPGDPGGGAGETINCRCVI